MSKVEFNVEDIIAAFPDYGEVVGYKPITAGHINDTYIVEYKLSDVSIAQYLLQRINTVVFKKPVEVMDNVVGITAHLRKKIEENGGDPTRETLTVYPAKDGKNYYSSEKEGFWRMYNFVGDTFSISELTNPEDFKNAALSFGNFQNLLADYPIETLYETIPNFHNTPARFETFKASVEKNASGRKNQAIPEIEFALAREKDCAVITDLIAACEMPVIVTHNDTKLNNVLFDNITKKGICIVDLDTVMPGSSLYDFGDSIRFGANTAAEDETDLSKVTLSLEYFKAYVDGILKQQVIALLITRLNILLFQQSFLPLSAVSDSLQISLMGTFILKLNTPSTTL